MRTVSLLHVASMLFSGCGSYYQKVNQGSMVDPNPREYLDLGDSVRLELRDGTQLVGTIERLRTDSVTVNGEVISWSEVIAVETLEESVGLTIVGLAAIGALSVLFAIASSFSNRSSAFSG